MILLKNRSRRRRCGHLNGSRCFAFFREGGSAIIGFKCGTSAPNRFTLWIPGGYFDLFFLGRFFRFVPANSLSCFLLIDFAICLEAPLSFDFFISPRLAARAAPAAICCFFDLAGILDYRARGGRHAYRSDRHELSGSE